MNIYFFSQILDINELLTLNFRTMKKIFTIFILLSSISLSSLLAQTITDIDGNVYNTVIIGTQIWMAENLNVTKLNDGASISLVTDNTAWSNLSTPGYCWYNNDQTTYGNTYGALYNWYTVNTGKLCPTGWYASSGADWEALITYLGGGSVAGGKMKETGTTHWSSPNTGATNESGFTALPGGRRNGSSGLFSDINNTGNWWSALSYNSGSAYFASIYNTASSLSSGSSAYPKTFGYSVRCLKTGGTGIENINNYENIKIYPNPANDKIEIEGLQNCTIEIVNIQGKVVNILYLMNINNTIDLSKLSGGVYTMKIKTDNRIIVKKFIKQ
ncbi:MAG: hypothetical protein A2X01_18820 [Bacteroidetes bacterium GWF2_35_48]|nr:MAG: hypothetical protein A2X01_18820 [Bacteroidetes bacterium GWF2_35_48]